MKRARSTPQLTAPVGLAPSAPVPQRIHPIDIFSSKVRAFYVYAYGGWNEAEETSGSNFMLVEKEGKYWADFKLKADTWSGAGIGMARTNLKPFVGRGALQFYIRGSKGGEVFQVGFLMSPGLKADERTYASNMVPLANYVQVTTNWQLVNIPLSDFPVGVSGKNGTLPFNWTRVCQFQISRGPGSDEPQFQLSNIRIVPSYK
jgi:hypothetical protein